MLALAGGFVRCVFGIVRLCQCLTASQPLYADALSLLLRLPAGTLATVAVSLARGLRVLLHSNGLLMTERSQWSVAMSLIQSVCEVGGAASAAGLEAALRDIPLGSDEHAAAVWGKLLALLPISECVSRVLELLLALAVRVVQTADWSQGMCIHVIAVFVSLRENSNR